MKKHRDRESCWDIAKRQAELARKRVARREGGMSRFLASPEGALLIVAGFALLNVTRSFGAALGESLALAARRRAESTVAEPNVELTPSPYAHVPWTPLVRVHERPARKIPAPSPPLSLSSVVRLLESYSKGYQVKPDAPSQDEAWAYLAGRLSPDALHYLRDVYAEAGGAWTPLKYDIVKRIDQAPELWSERGAKMCQEAAAELKAKAKPEGPNEP